MQHPKVSIILPVYGVEKYLSRCMKSVLNQTLKEIEIIMVDDGSPDLCPQLCDDFALQDDRVKVIHKTNQGLGFARNSGLEIATGEYIVFVDSDDFVDVDAFEILYNAAKESGVDAVFADAYIECPNGVWEKRQFTNTKRIISGHEMPKFVLDMIAGGKKDIDRPYPMSVWRILYKREIIQNYRLTFLSERAVVSEDLPFQIDFFSHANNVLLLPYSFYHYCLNDSSLTNTFSPVKFERFLTLYLLIKDKVQHIQEGNQRSGRFLVYYTRYHIMDMLKSNYSCKTEHIKRIVNDHIWMDLRNAHVESFLSVLNRAFFWLLLHRCVYGILLYAELINIGKSVMGKR